MRKKRIIDDGRVVAPMNVDGMPWNQAGSSGSLPLQRVPGSTPLPCHDTSNAHSSQHDTGDAPLLHLHHETSNAYLSRTRGAITQNQPLSRRENMVFAFGVLKAVLLVTLVYIGAFFAFILFCVNIWFR